MDVEINYSIVFNLIKLVSVLFLIITALAVRKNNTSYRLPVVWLRDQGKRETHSVKTLLKHRLRGRSSVSFPSGAFPSRHATLKSG